LQGKTKLKDLLHGRSIFLPRAKLSKEVREKLFDAAVVGFRSLSFAKVDVSSSLRPPNFDADKYSSPLVLLLTALLLVMGDTADGSVDDGFDGILLHEQQIWQRKLKTSDEDVLEDCQRSIAALTLVGGCRDKREFVSLSERAHGQHDKKWASLVQRLYPLGSAGLGPLVPDRLGEYLVWKVLPGEVAVGDDGEAVGSYLDEVLDGCSQAQLKNAFIVLGRISLDKEEGERWLRLMVKQSHVAARAQAALDASLALGSETAHCSLVRLLAKSLSDLDDDAALVDFAEIVYKTVDSTLVSYCEVGVWACKFLLRNRDGDCQDPSLLWTYGNFLGSSGRVEEAAEALQAVVEEYRRLAAARPDAYEGELAGSLHNLGNRWSSLRRMEEAVKATQEAVGIYQRLAAGQPDVYAGDLARSLRNLNIIQRRA